MAEALVGDRFSASWTCRSSGRARPTGSWRPFSRPSTAGIREPLHLFADEADFYAPQKAVRRRSEDVRRDERRGSPRAHSGASAAP